jgi:PAS domain S-box-containing protein
MSFRARNAEGAYRWFLSRAEPLRSNDGTVLHWIGINLDIEDRKQAEFYLAEGQRLAHTGSWAFTAGGFKHWSPELFAIHGLVPSDRAPSIPEYMALVHPDDREFVAHKIQRMLAEHRGFDFTKRIVRPDGTLRYVRCVGVAETNGEGFVGTGIDVTEQEQLTAALRRSKAYLTEAQRLSLTGSFGCEVSSGEMFWSEETFRIFGYNRATTPAVEAILERVHPADKARVQEQIHRATREGKDCDLEYRLLLPNDSVKHVHVVARAARDESSGRTEYIGAVMDVTEGVEAHQALEKANSEIQAALRARFEAALAERTRIAQELHDTLLQGFAGVTLQLKTAELALPDQPDVAAETLARVHRLATEALREARESVWDLRGSELDELDLIEALRGRALAATAGSNLAATVTARGVPRRLPRRIEAAALRVGREALANAVKHAEASRIEIDVQFGAALLALQIRDDGRGFTQNQLETAIRSGHFGITSMQDRAGQVGGTCEVGPGAQGGTLVTLRLPLGEQGA